MITREILKNVIESQRDTLLRMEGGVKREKEHEVKAEKSFALIITGVRRCGKSTFLRQLLEKHKNAYYVNFEDPRLDGFDLTDFNKIEDIMKELYGSSGIYFFDEIQNIERWEKFIRYLVDRKERVVITGSNASLLSRELGTKLTGRHLQTEMFPFSYNEFLAIKRQTACAGSFSDYLHLGGFPEFLKTGNPLILNELLTDIVIKDIAIRFGIKNAALLNKLAIFLLSNAGKEFSYNSIKNVLGIKSVQSVIDYISYFENAYLVFTIPRFSHSYKQQLVNPKKVYSIDNGFSSVNSASFSQDKGRMLENVVFLEMRRHFREIFYLKEGGECDFVIKEKDRITKAVQVCFNFNEETKEREINGLLTAVNKFNLQEGLLLTYDQEDEFLVNGKRIIIKPVWKWLSFK